MKGKNPAFLFYAGDWLKDPLLRLCSFRAKGVWIDLIALAFEMPEKGVFNKKVIENEAKTDSKTSQKRPLSEDEILSLLSGKDSEKKKGFKELKDREIIKKESDGTYYCKRLREVCRLSAIRAEAGKQGGNPKLLQKLDNQMVNQNDKQNGKQNLTPSVSVSVTENKTHKPPSGGTPCCPHTQIIELYHEVLPELPKVTKIDGHYNWNGDREVWLRARWKEAVEMQDIERWKEFFMFIRKSKFLMGQVEGKDGRRFQADLPWIIRLRNYQNIRDGKYHK